MLPPRRDDEVRPAALSRVRSLALGRFLYGNLWGVADIVRLTQQLGVAPG
jgi:hypothetical protein